MENWNIKEETGRQYVYVSKLGNDTLAKNYFGYADVWQSDTVGRSYVIGDRRRSSALSTNSSYIQYRAKTNHVKGATAPNADATNWEFDIDNFQEYLTTITYTVGSKTVYGNEHYVCKSAGTTGAFDLTKWDKVIISNKDVPFYSESLATTFILGTTGYNGGRFVGSYSIDYNFNITNFTLNIILGVGLFSTTIGSTNTKIFKLTGTNKRNTIVNYIYTYGLQPILCDNITLNIGVFGICLLSNCIIKTVTYLAGGGGGNILFCYNNVFIGATNVYNSTSIRHCVNNTFLNTNVFLNVVNTGNISLYTYPYTIIKNNYFSSTVYLPKCVTVYSNNFDYNAFVSGVYVSVNDGGGTSYTLCSNISQLRAAIPNQNLNSNFISTEVFNLDYTLTSDSSPLYRTGAYGRNIGCTSIGFKKSELDSFSILSGATYKNIKIDTGKFVRDQINKSVVSSTLRKTILDSSASIIDDEYNGFRIKIVSGTGVGQTRTIFNYIGSTQEVETDTEWDIIPDNTSVYDILDGEVYSPKIDLGRVVRLKNAQFFSNFISDVNGKYIEVVDWTNTDGTLQPKYTFKMNYSVDDVIYSGLKEFLIDEPLRIDTSGYGNGDANFVRDNQLDSTINVRYCYINFALREV